MLPFAGAVIGALPKLGVAVGMVVSYKPPSFWGVGIEGAVTGAEHRTEGGVTLDVSMAWAGLALCPLHGTRESGWVSVCGKLNVASFQAKSRDTPASIDRTDLVWLPGISGRLALKLHGPFVFGAGAALSVPITPVSYAYQGATGETEVVFEGLPVIVTTNLILGLVF